MKARNGRVLLNAHEEDFAAYAMERSQRTSQEEGRSEFNMQEDNSMLRKGNVQDNHEDDLSHDINPNCLFGKDPSTIY